jgi:hypothetical protein
MPPVRYMARPNVLEAKNSRLYLLGQTALKDSADRCSADFSKSVLTKHDAKYLVRTAH